MQKIAAKIVAVMEKCSYVQKDGDNKQQKYKYVSEGAVLSKIQPLLVEQKLIAVPKFTVICEKEKPTATGALWQFCTVKCEMTIIDSESGESVVVESLGQGVDPNDKGIAKAQTMAQKYSWLKLLQLETGDDPEKDENTDKQRFVQQAQQINANPNWCSPVGSTTFVLDTKNPPKAELERLWGFTKWGMEKLPGYIEGWAKNKGIQQINDTAYTALLRELLDYTKSQGLQIESVPF